MLRVRTNVVLIVASALGYFFFAGLPRSRSPPPPGPGFPVLAAVSTGIYLVVALAFPLLTRRLPRSATAISLVQVRYPDGQGMLREVLKFVTAQGFAVDELSTAAAGDERRHADGARDTATGRPMVKVTLQVHGRGLVNELAAGLSEIPGVLAVIADDAHTEGE